MTTVYDIADQPDGDVVAISQAYCLYRLPRADRVCVASWSELASDHVCPVELLD